MSETELDDSKINWEELSYILEDVINWTSAEGEVESLTILLRAIKEGRVTITPRVP